MPLDGEIGALLHGVVRGELSCDDVVLERLRSAPLVRVSQMMGQYLKDEEHVVSAVRVLGLATLNRRDRTDEEVNVMLRFFAGKLSSMQTVVVAVEATSLIVQELSLAGPCSSGVFEVLHVEFLQNFSLQALPTNARRWGYDVLRFMITKDTSVWFTTPFLRAVLRAMDEEGEPEFVVQALELHRVIASHVSTDAMQPLLEEYFDSISSYFPVVFSPSPGCKVTREDLGCALSSCMTHPLYLGPCIAFLLSRLASPSSTVKQEASSLLLAIVSPDSEHTTESLCPHVVSLTNHIRNEVVRTVSLGTGQCGLHVKDCLDILKSLSKRAQSVSRPVVRSWLEPVTSGALVSLDSGPAVCSAYATMFYHLVSGGARCAAVVAQGVLLQLLSFVRENVLEADDAVSIVSAMLTGVFDIGEAVECGDRLSLPSLVREGLECARENLFHVAEMLALSQSCANASSLLVRCGMLSSLMVLAAWLHPWMPNDTALLVNKKLVELCLCGDEATSGRVAEDISRIGRVEGNTLTAALLDLGDDVKPTARGVLTLYRGLLSSSASVALFATKLLLEHPEGLFRVALGEKDVFSLCRSGLSARTEFSAGDILPLVSLASKRNCPASFDYLCDLLLLLPAALVPTAFQAAGEEPWSVLTAALISCFDLDILGASDRAERWLRDVVGIARDAPTCALTMQSVSALCARVAGAGDAFLGMSKYLNATTRLAVGAAVARGFLSGSVTVGTCVDSIVEDIATSLREECVADHYLDVLSATFVSCDEGMRKVTTLLSPLVRGVATGAIPASLRLLRVITRLLQSETVISGLVCGDIVDFVRGLSKPHNEDFVCELVEMLDLTLSQTDTKGSLVSALLETDDLLPLLLSGVKSPSLKVRCASLRLMSELALFAMQSSLGDSADANPCVRSALQVRDEILHVSQVALGDHKRMVRRSAAQCRHQWYKLK